MRRPVVLTLMALPLLALVFEPATPAQDITTAAIVGTVADFEGGVLPGVVINAVHEPTGTHYSAVTRADGRYSIREVRVGGPYQVTATMVGFKTQSKMSLFAKLGQELEVDFELELDSIEEAEIEQEDGGGR